MVYWFRPRLSFLIVEGSISHFFFSQIEISFIVKIPNSYKLIGPNKPDLKPTTRHPRSGNPKTRSTPTDSGAAQTPTHHRTSFTTQGILPRKASAPARSRPYPKPTDPNTLKHDLRSHKKTVYHWPNTPDIHESFQVRDQEAEALWSFD